MGTEQSWPELWTTEMLSWEGQASPEKRAIHIQPLGQKERLASLQAHQLGVAGPQARS